MRHCFLVKNMTHICHLKGREREREREFLIIIYDMNHDPDNVVLIWFHKHKGDQINAVYVVFHWTLLPG